MQGVARQAAKSTAVVNVASKMLGTPYVWGGNTPGKALDCAGFLQQAFARVGIKLPLLVWRLCRGAAIHLMLLRRRHKQTNTFLNATRNERYYPTLVEQRYAEAQKRGWDFLSDSSARKQWYSAPARWQEINGDNLLELLDRIEVFDAVQEPALVSKLRGASN